METPHIWPRGGEVSGANAETHYTTHSRLTSAPRDCRNRASSTLLGREYGSTNVNDEATVVLGDNHGTMITHHHHHPPATEKMFTVLHESLAFDRIHTRLHNVARALPSTCDWIFGHPQFITWQASGGFLWIKGKPGSGKSTIMKEVHCWAEKTWTTHCVLSYFFNARSPNEIEKSPLGLYRSVLYQLLSTSSLCHDLFLSTFQYKIKTRDEMGNKMEPKVMEAWAEIELQNFLIEYFHTKSLPAILLFVDALDEGSEIEVRQMIRFLERLSQHAGSLGTPLCLCLSSRHYPNITVRSSLEVIVEDQHGQRKDIETYISCELLGDADDNRAHVLRHATLDRSGGIFLWVVLVIPMLNTLYDQGKGIEAMLNRLSGIPNDLQKLFANILSGDAEDTEQRTEMFRWVLYSERPMSLADLYCIVHHAYCGRSGADTLPDALTMYRSLLTYSRGLTELTKSTPPVMQFIHETVRNYLLGSGLPQPTPGDNLIDLSREALNPAFSHMILAERCLEYFLHVQSCQRAAEIYGKNHSMSLYSATSWWSHFRKSSMRESENLTRLAVRLFKDSRMFSNWWVLKQTEGKDFGHGLDILTLSKPLYCAIAMGMPLLVSALLSAGEDKNAVDSSDGTPLLAAIKSGHAKIVEILLKAGVDIHRKARPYHRTPLEAAVVSGDIEIVGLLLDSMADDKSQTKYGSALVDASYAGRTVAVQMLLKDGADPDLVSTNITALQVSSALGQTDIVQLLLDGGAQPNLQSECGSSMLRALTWGHGDVVSLLLKAGARLTRKEAQDHDIEAMKARCYTRGSSSLPCVSTPPNEVLYDFDSVEGHSGGYNDDRSILPSSVSKRKESTVWTIPRLVRWTSPGLQQVRLPFP